MADNNPFLRVSLLPYQAPQFDLIDDTHYRPAFDEGVRRQREEIAAIVNNPAPADFANTLVALEQSGQLLARVTRVFFAMAGAHTNPTIQALSSTAISAPRQLMSPVCLKRSANLIWRP